MSKEKEVVELTLAERISLLSILPQEANFATLKIMRTLKEGLSFSEEEHKDYEIKVDIGDNGNIGYAWNEEGVKSEKAIKIGEYKFLNHNYIHHFIKIIVYFFSTITCFRNLAT